MLRSEMMIGIILWKIDWWTMLAHFLKNKRKSNIADLCPIIPDVFNDIKSSLHIVI